jgi:hypothetical protein
VTKIVIDFEYVYMFIDMEKSFYRFSMELFQRAMPAEMIYKWVTHLTIDHRLVEVRLTKIFSNLIYIYIFIFIYQMVDVPIHLEIQILFLLCVLEMVMAMVVLIHRPITFVQV